MKPHEVPLQVEVPPAGGTHAVQDDPQLAVLVLERQLVPQRWVVPVQVKSQDVPLQVDAPPAGGTHGVQDVVPQLLMLVFNRHAMPQG
ncbi:MAG: hypothetical protein H7X95_13010 [Deltaproteobacteria bacterium]|nr:hypothetical protein [Deltaproteobacteria bacterium]